MNYNSTSGSQRVLGICTVGKSLGVADHRPATREPGRNQRPAGATRNHKRRRRGHDSRGWVAALARPARPARHGHARHTSVVVLARPARIGHAQPGSVTHGPARSTRPARSESARPARVGHAMARPGSVVRLGSEAVGIPYCCTDDPGSGPIGVVSCLSSKLETRAFYSDPRPRRGRSFWRPATQRPCQVEPWAFEKI
jgi:hypothetical protein